MLVYWGGGGVRVGNTETQICSNISAFKYSSNLSCDTKLYFPAIRAIFAKYCKGNEKDFKYVRATSLRTLGIQSEWNPCKIWSRESVLHEFY